MSRFEEKKIEGNEERTRKTRTKNREEREEQGTRVRRTSGRIRGAWDGPAATLLSSLRRGGAGRYRSGRRVTGREDGSRATGGSSRLAVCR